VAGPSEARVSRPARRNFITKPTSAGRRRRQSIAVTGRYDYGASVAMGENQLISAAAIFLCNFRSIRAVFFFLHRIAGLLGNRVEKQKIF